MRRLDTGRGPLYVAGMTGQQKDRSDFQSDEDLLTYYQEHVESFTAAVRRKLEGLSAGREGLVHASSETIEEATRRRLLWNKPCPPERM